MSWRQHFKPTMTSDTEQCVSLHSFQPVTLIMTKNALRMQSESAKMPVKKLFKTTMLVVDCKCSKNAQIIIVLMVSPCQIASSLYFLLEVHLSSLHPACSGEMHSLFCCWSCQGVTAVRARWLANVITFWCFPLPSYIRHTCVKIRKVFNDSVSIKLVTSALPYVESYRGCQVVV